MVRFLLLLDFACTHFFWISWFIYSFIYLFVGFWVADAICMTVIGSVDYIQYVYILYMHIVTAILFRDIFFTLSAPFRFPMCINVLGVYRTEWIVFSPICAAGCLVAGQFVIAKLSVWFGLLVGFVAITVFRAIDVMNLMWIFQLSTGKHKIEIIITYAPKWPHIYLTHRILVAATVTSAAAVCSSGKKHCKHWRLHVFKHVPIDRWWCAIRLFNMKSHNSIYVWDDKWINCLKNAHLWRRWWRRNRMPIELIWSLWMLASIHHPKNFVIIIPLISNLYHTIALLFEIVTGVLRYPESEGDNVALKTHVLYASK